MRQARLKNNSYLLNAEEAVAVSPFGEYACGYCDTKVVLVRAMSGRVKPHFRSATNSMHLPECEYYVELNVDFDTEDAGVEEKQATSNIIQIANSISIRLIEMFARNPEKLKTMDRRQFEQLVAELFYGFGYDVELTKQTRDNGMDIIAVSNRVIIKQKYIIECKRPDPDNPVGIEVVKCLHATKIDEGANKAILVTTTRFTSPARKYEAKHSIDLQLNDFHDLVDWLRRYLQIKNS